MWWSPLGCRLVVTIALTATGIQNFPEGLAVSMPLRSAGVGYTKAFFFGQLSGAVEPVAGAWGGKILDHPSHFHHEQHGGQSRANVFHYEQHGGCFSAQTVF